MIENISSAIGIGLTILLVPIVLRLILGYSFSKGWSKFPSIKQVKSVSLYLRIAFVVLLLIFFFFLIYIFYLFLFNVFIGLQQSFFTDKTTVFFLTDSVALTVFLLLNFLTALLWTAIVFELIERLTALNEKVYRLLFVLAGGSARIPFKIWVGGAIICLLLTFGSGFLLFDKYIKVDENGIIAPLKDDIGFPFSSKKYSFDEVKVEVFIELEKDEEGTECYPHFDLVFDNGNKINLWEIPGLITPTKKQFDSLISFFNSKNVEFDFTPISEYQRTACKSLSKEFKEEIEFVFDKANK